LTLSFTACRSLHKVKHGWAVQDTSSPGIQIILKEDLSRISFGEHSLLYARSIVKELMNALKGNHDMQLKNANFIVLLIDEFLMIFMNWLNHHIFS